MRRRAALALTLLLFAFAQRLLCLGAAAAADDPRKDSPHPPAPAGRGVRGYWGEGSAAGGGITADLEAMQRVGLGGALIMDVTQDIPPGPVRFGSPQWRQMFNHAITE